MAAELGKALAIVMAINFMLIAGQVAAIELGGSLTFYDCQDSLIGGLDAADCTGDPSTWTLANNNPSNQLPQESGEIETGQGNVFTDTFNAIRTWFASSAGLGYLYNLVFAPMNFLGALGTPPTFAFMLGSMWYGFTFFMIVAFFFGRDY